MKNKAFHFLLLGVLNVGLLQLADCDKIRVVGPSRCSGRVEVFHDNSWGTVCDDYWSLNNADVVCRELNCGTALEATSRAFFGEGKNNIHLDDVKCEGTESSLSKCPHRELGENNCGHGEDAGVICSEHLRLVNGTDRCSGRVEVYHGGHWKKLCDNNWTSKEANVVCRELTCGTPSKDHVPHFGQHSGKNGVSSNCYGNETSLGKCPIEAFNDTCVDATVLCKNVNMVRLANGTSRCSGRVEVFHNAQWGTVCDDRWGMQDATVTCQEVNCGQPMAVKYRAFFGEGNGQVWMDDVECNGHEKSITECTHRGFGENDCGHAEDASVICSDKIRLANSTDRCSGRVELYHRDEWVKLCSNDWSMSKAALLCNELECGAPFNPQVTPYFGESKSGMRGFTSRCVGNETSFTDCPLQHNPATCENVALTCKGQLKVKLVNGTDRCSGRVEVYHDGQWGTVCDDQWDLNDAQVVCREVDCGTAQATKPRGFFGKGLGEIWLDDMECVGHEVALDACPHNAYGDNNCGHAEDAGVICSSTIRLYNGTGHCSGRLEVYHGGQWLPVYDSSWGTRESGVVCREMDCGDAVLPLPTSSVHVPYTGQRGFTVSCQGTETSLTQCSLREYVKTSRDNVKEATVSCTGTVKLVNGSNRCAGRVEYYRNGQWGKVCGDSWDMNDAQVVCSQLSCGRAHKVLNTDEYGLGGGKIWIESIECNGRESSLSQCVQTEDPSIACNHSSVASVICSDNLDVRLVGAPDHCSGRVEVLHGEQWGTLCEHGWTMNEAELVCKMLECGKAVSAPGGAHFGQGTGPVWEASQACFSSAASLHQCTVKGFNATRCAHEEDAGVVCAEQLRLVNGRGQCSGRVEVFHKGLWGTVCDDEWEIANAEVVCRQMGCGVAISALTSAHFGRGDGPIWLDNVECTGSESALTQCTHNAFGENNCGHGEDAGVVCLGSLPKPQITVSPGPEVRWGERVEITCMMITEHLGGTFVLQKTPGTYRQEKYTDNEAAVFIIPKVDYSHKGSYHCEYRKRLATQNIEFPLGETAELSVTVMLETPSISLTSPHAMVIFSPDNLEVNQGSSFSITCSIHSQYVGGFFYLTTTKSNVSEPKPVFTHSVFLLAYFDFPAVEYKDQGEYRCVYGVNISALTFRSEPSKSLRITVIASSVSPAVSGVLGGLLVLLLLLGGAYLLWRKRHQIGRASVRFSSRVGELREAVKEDTGANKGHVAFDGRDFNSIVNDQGNNREDKSSDADSSNTVDRNDARLEDLTGRVCYELEPLIHDDLS